MSGGFLMAMDTMTCLLLTQWASEPKIDSPLAEETLTVARFEIYKDNQGEFRWLLRSGNGRSIASSGEGYKTKAEAQGAIAVVKRDAPAADVDDQTATTF
jgi:uncharacterized protein YegP (UPF0339 family)